MMLENVVSGRLGHPSVESCDRSMCGGVLERHLGVHGSSQRQLPSVLDSVGQQCSAPCVRAIAGCVC